MDDGEPGPGILLSLMTLSAQQKVLPQEDVEDDRLILREGMPIGPVSLDAVGYRTPSTHLSDHSCPRSPLNIRDGNAPFSFPIVITF
jgi:hypothetical protein